MKILTLICRILLGLIFVVFGLNGFLHFIHMGPPPPAGSIPANYMSSLSGSGIMSIVYGMEVLGGALVLLGGTTPLGLVVLGPVIVNALMFHLFMLGGHGIINALAAALLELFLIFAYRANFAGILSTTAKPVVQAI